MDLEHRYRAKEKIAFRELALLQRENSAILKSASNKGSSYRNAIVCYIASKAELPIVDVEPIIDQWVAKNYGDYISDEIIKQFHKLNELVGRCDPEIFRYTVPKLQKSRFAGDFFSAFLDFCSKHSK